MSYEERMPESDAMKLHRENRGKIEVRSKVDIKTRADLALAYTPGVAEVSMAIVADRSEVYNLTNKANFVAVISDGSAVLGLGNIGAEAALPVMEGKCVLFKQLGGVDAIPICVKDQDKETIINVAKQISPVLGGINLEDIAAPKCFEIEETLKKSLDIPVMHDDQHGTAVVVLAALINALKVAEKKKEDIKIVVSGAGAGAIATTKMLLNFGIGDIILVDSKGIISKNRSSLIEIKRSLAEVTNKQNIDGSLADAVKASDIFIGLSKGGLLTQDMVKTMAEKPIVCALANPIPEIFPDEAKAAGAFIVATGRSDFPNQINNSLGFPAIFRGALDVRASDINEEMKLAAAHALADAVPNPTADQIMPEPLDKEVFKIVSKAVAEAAKQSDVARI